MGKCGSGWGRGGGGIPTKDTNENGKFPSKEENLINKGKKWMLIRNRISAYVRGSYELYIHIYYIYAAYYKLIYVHILSCTIQAEEPLKGQEYSRF